MHLERDPAGALLVRSQEDVQRGGVAEERNDVLGIAAPLEHALPCAGEADQTAADVQVFKEEALNVIRLHSQSLIGQMSRPAVDPAGVICYMDAHADRD